MGSNTELVWIPKELAGKLSELADDHKQMERVIDDFYKSADREMLINLEALDERVIEYKALSIKARAVFTEACIDTADKSEELFLNWDEKMPSVRQKVDAIRDEIKPLHDDLTSINELMGKIDTWKIKQVVDTMREISTMDAKTWEMLSFLQENYKRGE